LPIREV
jgi:hypothetical protein